MKTALESLDALEALARKIATHYNTGSSRSDELTDQSFMWMRDAQAIVSELPEPISKDTLEARALVAKCARWFSVDEEMAKNIEGGKWDDSRAGLVQEVAEAIRRAREEGMK